MNTVIEKYQISNYADYIPDNPPMGFQNWFEVHEFVKKSNPELLADPVCEIFFIENTNPWEARKKNKYISVALLKSRAFDFMYEHLPRLKDLDTFMAHIPKTSQPVFELFDKIKSITIKS